MPRSVFIHSPELDRGGYPPGCPFNSKRAGMTRNILDSMGLLIGTDVSKITPLRASRDELEMFHSPHYLDATRHDSRVLFAVYSLSHRAKYSLLFWLYHIPAPIPALRWRGPQRQKAQLSQCPSIPRTSVSLRSVDRT